MDLEMGLAYKAMQYATHKHATQLRKFTKEPYVTHLAEVAGICATVSSLHTSVCPETIISVAWLHDVVEDTDASLAEIFQQFGKEVGTGVQWITCVPHEDTNLMQEAYTKQLAMSPSWVQTVKLADMISNLRNVWAHDTKFATGFTRRCKERIDVMVAGAPTLRQMAIAMTVEPKKKKHEKSKV